MKEIKEWTRDELLLLLNLLSYGIDNELLPNVLEKSGLPKKEMFSIRWDETRRQAYYHFNNLIAKRLATEPRLPMPLQQMIDTALDGADALILLYNVEINTEDDMREFLRLFNFSMGRLPVEDLEAGHDVPLHAFLNTQESLRSVTKKVLKYVEDNQTPQLTEMETFYLQKAENENPTHDGPGTLYLAKDSGFDKIVHNIYNRIEEFQKDMKQIKSDYHSPRQGNPGLITFEKAFLELQERLQGKADIKFRQCAADDCDNIFRPKHGNQNFCFDFLGCQERQQSKNNQEKKQKHFKEQAKLIAQWIKKEKLFGVELSASTIASDNPCQKFLNTGHRVAARMERLKPHLEKEHNITFERKHTGRQFDYIFSEVSS